MIKSIIVEDEQKNRETLYLMLKEYCPEVEVLAQCADIAAAKLAIEDIRPELVFLDVEMPPYTAFDLLKSLKSIDFEIVFVTAFNYYAIDAIKFSALYYILKPIKVSDLQEAVEKACEKIGKKDDYLAEKMSVLFQNPDQMERIVINTTQETFILKLSEISFITADNSYSTIYKTNKEKIMSSKPLSEFDKLLSPKHFYRAHKSNLINILQIDRINKGEKLTVSMNNGYQVPVSQRRKDELMSLLKK